MTDPVRFTSVFTLDVASGDHAPSAGRLFVAVVLRTIGADEEIVEDAKLAISEALTAAILAGHETIRVSIDSGSGLVSIGPLSPADLAGDGADVINALFSGMTIGEALQFTIPLGGSLP